MRWSQLALQLCVQEACWTDAVNAAVQLTSCKQDCVLVLITVVLLLLAGGQQGAVSGPPQGLVPYGDDD